MNIDMSYLVYALLGLGVLSILLLVWCIILNVQVCRLNRARKVKLEQGTSEEIVAALDSLMADNQEEKNMIGTLSQLVSNLQKEANSPMNKVGLCRYDLGDAGGKQSFSLALLNEKNKGIILRGLFSRDISRLYCIKVDEDGTDKELQAEDLEAYRNAVKQ